MEEKILIKSRMNEKVRSFLKFAPIICFGIAALISILLAIPTEETYYSYWSHRYYTYKIVGWESLFDFDGVTILYFIEFVLGSLCLIASIVIGIIYLANRKCELQITENNVKGKTLFGKEVVLPLYMISAYSTRKLLSVVAVATASGITKFSLIENYEEIGDVLSQLINQRQRNTQVESNQSSPKSDSIDDLLKLKTLLDSGIITQEEFDAKKKQLLDL